MALLFLLLELLDAVEFGEAATNTEYDETATNSASELGLMVRVDYNNNHVETRTADSFNQMFFLHKFDTVDRRKMGKEICFSYSFLLFFHVLSDQLVLREKRKSEHHHRVQMLQVKATDWKIYQRDMWGKCWFTRVEQSS